MESSNCLRTFLISSQEPYGSDSRDKSTNAVFKGKGEIPATYDFSTLCVIFCNWIHSLI